MRGVGGSGTRRQSLIRRWLAWRRAFGWLASALLVVGLVFGAAALPPATTTSDEPPRAATLDVPVDAGGADEAVYTFGVFPYLPPLTIDRIFAPIMQALSDGLGRSVDLRTKETFAAFLAELPRGRYDFALVHPFFYVEAVDRHGYLPVVRLDEPLRAVVVARRPTPVATLDGLRGKVLALPPALAAVTEIMRAELAARDIVPGRDLTLRHFQSKASCLHALDVGDAQGCALPRFALRQLPPAETETLDVVFESAPMPGLAIVAHRRLPDAVRARLARLVLDWPATEQGRAILASAQWPGFVVARDADYDDIRRRLGAGGLDGRQHGQTP